MPRCASRSEPPAYAAVPPAQDDDAFCRAGGKVAVGSPDYVYCRKDRDAARNAAVTAAADRKHAKTSPTYMDGPLRGRFIASVEAASSRLTVIAIASMRMIRRYSRDVKLMAKWC